MSEPALNRHYSIVDQRREVADMHPIALAIGFSFLAAKPAIADDFAACRSIKDNLARLTCYDEAADKPPAAAAPALPAGAPKPDLPTRVWTFEDSKSLTDDTPEVVATNESEAVGAKPSALIVRCKEHRTEIFVAALDTWGISTGAGRIAVLYKINNTAPVEQMWDAGQGPASVSFAYYPELEKAREFLVGLPDSGKIFFRVTDEQGATRGMLFVLDGIDEVRTRIGAACKWPAPSTPRPDTTANVSGDRPSTTRPGSVAAVNSAAIGRRADGPQAVTATRMPGFRDSRDRNTERTAGPRQSVGNSINGAAAHATHPAPEVHLAAASHHAASQHNRGEVAHEHNVSEHGKANEHVVASAAHKDKAHEMANQVAKQSGQIN